MKLSFKGITSILSTFVVAAGILTVSCSSNQPAASSANIEGEWNITEANGVSTENGDTTATISFTTDGKVNGNTSVNYFFGEYTFNNDTLTFNQMGATKRMGGSMDVEQAILEALAAVKTASVKNNEAVLMDNEGNEVIVLTKKETK